MKKFPVRLTSVSPLIMNNGQKADPLNYYHKKLKELSAKKKKTDADYEEIAHIEFIGGLYLDEDGPIMPNFLLEACLMGKGGAARKEKAGPQAKAGLYVEKSSKLFYDGPVDPEELWKNKNFVYQRVLPLGMSGRITRTRPIFNEWAAEFVVVFNESVINESDLKRWLSVAGSEVGLGDWRPRFGRFEWSSI